MSLCIWGDPGKNALGIIVCHILSEIDLCAGKLAWEILLLTPPVSTLCSQANWHSGFSKPHAALTRSLRLARRLIYLRLARGLIYIFFPLHVPLCYPMCPCTHRHLQAFRGREIEGKKSECTKILFRRGVCGLNTPKPVSTCLNAPKR